MNKQFLKKIGLISVLLLNILVAQGQSIPFYVQEINYGFDLGHVNEDGISWIPNSLSIDEGDGSAPNATISPTSISSVRGAIVDGFHSEVDGTKYFSFDVDTRVNNVAVLKSDIIRCNDFNCTTFSYFFDSVSQNLQHVNINAFSFDVENGDLIFSVDGPATIGPLGVVAADLIRYNGSNFTLEYDSTSSIDGIGVNKNITGLSMMTTGEYGISLEEDGEYNNEFNYDNHWILKYSPQNRSWQWFYTILSFGDLENPLRLTSLMIRENDLIFKNGFD